MFENKKILVTGGTGFIGSIMSERLYIDEKADVRVMVNNWHKATWVSRLGVELVKSDITNPEEVDKAIEGCEIVFHCVGVGGTREYARKVNVEGTRNVMNACKKHGVKRIVYLSSFVVHGGITFDGMDEGAPFVSYNDAYADAKIEAEHVFWQLIKEYKLAGSVVRPTFVWGPLSPYYSVLYIQQMKNNSFYLIDKGIHDCNAVYVDNVIDLCFQCAYNPKAIGESFIATDGEHIKWKEYFTYYARMIGKDINEFKSIPIKEGLNRILLRFFRDLLQNMIRPITTLNDKIEKEYPFLAKWVCKAPRKLLKIPLKKIIKNLPEMDKLEMTYYSYDGFVNISKAKRLLDYSPKYSVKEGMAQTEIWLKDQNYL